MALFGKRPGRSLFADTSCPVEWSHPLNRGLVSWWRTIPGWGGGTAYRDLARGGKSPNDLTLGGRPTWSGAKGRAGGFGSLNFAAASSQYTERNNAVLSAYPWSVFAWFRPNALALAAQTVFSICSSTGTAGNNMVWILDVLASDSKLRLYVETTGSAFDSTSSTNTLSAASWAFCGAVLASATSRVVYLAVGNGPLVETPATVTAHTPSGMDRTSVGRSHYSGSPVNYADGLIDDVRLYNRALTLPEVSQIRHDTQRGCPATLRSLRRTAFGFTPAVVGGRFQPAWCQNTNRVMSVGRGF